MDFDLNDEQREIKNTARNLLAERAKPARVRELAEARKSDDELWKELCDLGWAGIALPEEHGGQGLGMVELATLCEELGYACAPVPFLGNAIAGSLIAEAGSDEQRAKWLPGIASGEARGAIALSPDEPALVFDAEGAAVFGVPVGGAARLVEAGDANLEPVDLIDATRSFARVSSDGGEEVASEVPAYRGMIAIAAELTGVAQRALDMAVEYARERQQFGRAIGAYQGVSHRCAQMLYDVEEARSLTYYAAWTADAEPEALPLATHMAKARASEAGWAVTANALQVFGGIGFTWEHDLQFWLKRARVDGELLGTAAEHRDKVAELTGIGASEPGPGLGDDFSVADDPGLAALAVVQVDDVVPPVAAEQPDQHHRPAGAADLLLDQGLGELDLGAVDLVVRALLLLDPVEEDGDRPLGAGRQSHMATGSRRSAIGELPRAAPRSGDRGRARA